MQAVEIHLQGKQGPVYPAWLIPWPLMTSRCKRGKQPWHGPSFHKYSSFTTGWVQLCGIRIFHFVSLHPINQSSPENLVHCISPYMLSTFLYTHDYLLHYRGYHHAMKCILLKKDQDYKWLISHAHTRKHGATLTNIYDFKVWAQDCE